MTSRNRAVVAAAIAGLLHACAPASEPDTPPGPSSASRSHAIDSALTATATAAVVAADSIRFSVTFRNAGPPPKAMEFGACPLNPMLRRDGREIWNYAKVERACLMYLAMHTVAPGDSLAPKEFVLTLPSAAIRGDSIAGGRYEVAILATWNDETHMLGVGSLVLP